MPEPPNSVEIRVQQAVARGELFQYINSIAALKRDEELRKGGTEKTTPGFPNMRGTIGQTAAAPQPALELPMPAEPITDDDILLAMLKIQWPLLCNVDLVKRFRTLLHRRTRDENDKVKKNRSVVEKTIGPLQPAIAAKFSEPILRIAADGKHGEQPRPEGTRP